MEAEVVGQYYEEHYRKWLDEPLPALDGRTPREAAALKSARPKLISLLKAMENMAERQRREGRPATTSAGRGTPSASRGRGEPVTAL